MINYRYNILKNIGIGRSSVFLAEDIYTNHKVALKFLANNFSAYEKLLFENEYKILKRLNHKSIVKVFNKESVFNIENDDKLHQIENGQHFLVLEYIVGDNLRNIINEIRDENEIRNIISRLSLILYYLHTSNYIYFDLKPENILVLRTNRDTKVKLVDFGLVHYEYDSLENTLRGSAMYMAPEILRNASIDNRIDFYSLGIILYELIYHKKPFETKSELDIYKSHLENLFTFEKNNYSERLNKILLKLLEKNPNDRYSNGLEIVSDLQMFSTVKIINNWDFTESFVYKEDYKKILEETDDKLILIVGEKETGKTTLLNYINENTKDSLLFTRSKFIPNYPIWKNILQIIIEREDIYINLNDNIKKLWYDIKQNKVIAVKESFMNIFSGVIEIRKFVFLFDDIDTYDEFTKSLIEEVIPVIYINNSKIYFTSSVNIKLAYNIKTVNLTSFSENELDEFLKLQFNKNFPVTEVKNFFLKKGNLVPGKIKETIKEMILLGVLSVQQEGIFFKKENDNINLLISSQDEIYNNKIDELNLFENKILKCVSAFTNGVQYKIIKSFLKLDEEELKSCLFKLITSNILKVNNEFYQFVGYRLSEIVYDSITEKDAYHYNLGLVLIDNYEYTTNMEIVEQFEAGIDYEKSYAFLLLEYFNALEYSAYQYGKNILIRAENYNLTCPLKLNYYYNSAKINFLLGDYNGTIKEIEKIEKREKPEDELIVLKASSLIELGKNSEGKKLLTDLLSRATEEKLLITIYFYLGLSEYNGLNYDKSIENLEIVINSKQTNQELTGRAFNLMGLIELNGKNNYSAAISYFKKSLVIYRKAKLNLKIAQAEMNIGNVLNMIGKHKEAIESWNRSLEINKSIGNLEQEAKLLINYGIAQHLKFDCDNAIAKYERAASILNALNNTKGLILVYINKAETFLKMCEYSHALESVMIGESLLTNLVEPNELFELMVVKSIICYELGNINELILTLEKQNKLLNNSKFTENDILRNKFIKLLLIYLQSEEIDTNEMSVYLNHFIENENIFLQHTAFDTLASYYYNKKDYDSINKLIIKNSSRIEAWNNLYSNALIKYYEAVGLKLNEEDEIKNILQSLRVSYKLLEEASINNLIFRVIFHMYKIYNKRGNINKSEEFKKIGLKITEYITASIGNDDLVNSFVSHPYYLPIYNDLLNMYQ